jgi:hypothetical protein
MHCCGGAEELKVGDGDAAATVAHAAKGGDDKEGENADAAAALPHAVAPLGAPSVYCCGCERSVYCCGGAEESKGGDGEEEKDGDATAASPQAVALVDEPSVYSRSGAEERKGCGGDAAATFAHAVAPVERQARRRRGFTASGEVTANRAAARSSAGSVKLSDSARFGSQTRYVRKLASRSGTGIRAHHRLS